MTVHFAQSKAARGKRLVKQMFAKSNPTRASKPLSKQEKEGGDSDKDRERQRKTDRQTGRTRAKERQSGRETDLAGRRGQKSDCICVEGEGIDRRKEEEQRDLGESFALSGACTRLC